MLTRSPLLSLLGATAFSMAGVLFSSFPLTGQAVELRQGRTVPGTLSLGDTVRYSVDLRDESFLFGEVDQISVDVNVRLLGPDGAQLRRFGSMGRGEERFFSRISDGGTHTIEVSPAGEGAGDFAITIHRAESLETDPKKLADQLMSPFDGEDSPGAAVQVWRGGRTLYSKGYGMANLAYGIPFEPDTRTNIGSTSKQFTGLAVMLQAERGLLNLDDDIRMYVPELPDFGETITIRHIITHTSGLREFANLLLMTDRQVMHGDWIERSELIEVVQRQPALQNSPGSEWNYNNTAFGLAALIVERTSGQDFDQFMQENVFGPLGMTRTLVRPNPEYVVEDMSEGYTPGELGFRQTGDLGASTGAGGIYSTVEDLQKWVENYSSARVGSRESLDQMMTSYVLTNGDTTGYGFGLSIDEQRGLKRVHHGGADLSHRSQLIYYPEINAGITVQSNHGAFNTSVADDLAEAFFADAMDPEEALVADGEGFDPDAYDPAAFDDFAGRYSLDAAPGVILTFEREGGTFYTQVAGQPRVEIVPTSDSSFALTAVDAFVEFHRDEDGQVDGVTLHQNGENHATRMEDDVAAWEPTVEDLTDFEGRYFSEELETFYDVVLEDESLVVQRRRWEDAELTSGDEDEFSGGGLMYAFERDRNRKVIGFYLSNGRSRDVRFERMR